LIEDEPGLVVALTDLLREEGYEVESAVDGPSGLARASGETFDLILLDVMLPGVSGFEVCDELRRQGKQVPLLMLTARTQVEDRVAGLKLGADDYLLKPFEPPELLARIEALLRRAQKKDLGPVIRYSFGNVRVDFETGEVSKNGVPVSLAGKEIDLLRYLIQNRGRVVPREELMKNVWDYQVEVSTRTIDVHVAWLRQKLEDSPQNPKRILTVRGVGYRFVA
jgi:two-component system alkaline phosphatase synthesis response regulator PhoP